MGVGSTEVETRLPFGHEVDSGVTLWGIGDNVCLDSGGPELALLRTTPPIGVGHHKFNVSRHGIPAVLSILVGGDKERFSRNEQIAHKIREEVDDGLSHWEICAHLVLQGRRWFCRTKQKLPPAIVSNRKRIIL